MSMKKRIIVMLIMLTLIFMNFIDVSAIVHTITFDWMELGVKHSLTNAPAEDYFGETEEDAENVYNLRCNYSMWDHAEEYLWLVSDWSNSKKAPAWLYIGDFDMSTIDDISFDYVTDGTSNLTDNRVSLVKDIDDKEIIAFADITETTGALKTPLSFDMEIQDDTYNGPVYIYIEYTARMFVGNLEFTTKDDGTTPSPTPEPTPTPTASPTKAPTKEPTPTPTDKEPVNKAMLYTFIAIGAVVVVGGGVIVFIWKKK